MWYQASYIRHALQPPTIVNRHWASCNHFQSKLEIISKSLSSKALIHSLDGLGEVWNNGVE